MVDRRTALLGLLGATVAGAKLAVGAAEASPAAPLRLAPLLPSSSEPLPAIAT